MAEFIHQIHFKRLLQENLFFKDCRKFCKYHKSHLFKQLLIQLIAGYFKDTAANTFAGDSSFKLVLDNLVASQPTLSRFINQISAEDLAGITKLVAKLAQLVITQKKQHQLIIDLDSTHTDTFGQPEGSAFNTHYQTNSYHLLLAFDSFSSCLLGAKLRLANEYTSKKAEDFLTPILQQYAELDLLVRADSGFTKPEIYVACEEFGASIRLKANRVRMLLASAAYNLVQTMKQLFLPA
nr:transposase [Ligilactobacillus pobuzihii]